MIMSEIKLRKILVVNDGGKKLEKSDLLFSTIVSIWEQGREEIEDLINIINKKGQGFNFDNDFIMRTCLYLMCPSSELKIENLGSANIKAIKDNWENIKNSIIKAIDLLNCFGFCSGNLVSKNVAIPVIYYIYKRGKLNDESISELRKYLIIAQVKQLFGAAGNSALAKIKKELNSHKLRKEGFKLSYFNELKFVAQRDFSVNEDLLEMFLTYNKGSPYAFMILSLLYSEIKMNEVPCYQERMHKYAKFNTKNLKSLGIKEEKIIEWQKMKDKLPNLQLLVGIANKSKKDMDLEEWFNKGNIDKYLPRKVSYKLVDFEKFYEKRKDLLKDELKKIFDVK